MQERGDAIRDSVFETEHADCSEPRLHGRELRDGSLVNEWRVGNQVERNTRL